MYQPIRFQSESTKEHTYQRLTSDLIALLCGETDLIANLANTSALLKEVFGWWWVGFYLQKGDELVLGPFQGTVACTRIAYGRGVCGNAWKQQATIIVPDVDQYPGHIACSAASKSEIVLPVFDTKKNFRGVLDIDSDQYGEFDETDRLYLEKIVWILADKF